ncbi:MAG: HDIG domain-containing protein [Kiritimatiellae bacterium]|nr:HDIG domain-containing protein [Kiritimatiellia bacterium]
MRGWISKSRVRKAKTRLKKGEAAGPRRSLRGLSRPLVGLLVFWLLWLSAVILLLGSRRSRIWSLAVGQAAPETVIAEVDFECGNVTLTKANQDQAAAAVPPVFAIDYTQYDAVANSIERFFNRIAQIRKQTGAENPDAVRAATIDALELLDIQLTAAETLGLAPEGQESDVASLIKKHLRSVWARGIVAQSERDNLFRGFAKVGSVSVQSAAGEPAVPMSLAEMPTPPRALQMVQDRVAADFPGGKLPKQAVASLLQTWVRPNLSNLIYDLRTTEALREKARADAAEVTMVVRSGDTIVRQGQQVVPQILEKLRMHYSRTKEAETPFDRAFNLVGNGGLLMVGLFVSACLLAILRPELLRRNAVLVLFFLISLMTLLLCRVLLLASHNVRWAMPAVVEFLLPLSLGPLLVTVLVGSTAALVLGAWLSFVMAVLAGHSFTVLVTGLVATVVAAYVARDTRKRLKVFKAGLLVGLAEATCALAVGALNQQAAAVLLWQALACAASGLFSAVVVLLLVPLFEALFKITTNITLLELSDLGHELLQRLAMEAPGTYHHSLVVANLAQAAAGEVGANSLLAMVGAYFHDIGKLTKPEFYSENIQHSDNPHDTLSPSMSALVILSHVKEGVSLGLQYKLPRPILDIIREHHGTSLVSYFYHKALEERGETAPNGGKTAAPTPVEEGGFRYSGPKPASNEAALISLADAVEAASRSIEKPTPARLTTLVNEVVAARLEDDQLAACTLTFADLTRVKRSFIFSLTNMLHGRVSYPKDENRDKQQADGVSAKQAPNKDAHSVPAGTGRPA